MHLLLIHGYRSIKLHATAQSDDLHPSVLKFVYIVLKVSPGYSHLHIYNNDMHILIHHTEKKKCAITPPFFLIMNEAIQQPLAVVIDEYLF